MNFKNKYQSYTVALLLGVAQAKNGFNSPYNMLEKFPAPNGTAPVMSTSAKTAVTCT
jgi:hypothetical protein